MLLAWRTSIGHAAEAHVGADGALGVERAFAATALAQGRA